MKLITVRAAWRLAIGLALLAGLGYGAGSYMTRCGGRVAMIGKPAEVSTERLQAHVTALAGEIGPRSVARPAQLQAAADYITREWRAQGHEVRRQEYEVNGVTAANLEVVFAGQQRPQEIIVVGAHYDTVDESPGANDNTSGVAALLELTRHWQPAARTVRFVAFVNEEPPWFQTEWMGSRVYARACRQRGDDVRAMIALETMGYFRDTPGSQQFPSKLFNLFYPTTGNFIAFVSDFKSRPVLRQAVAAFRGATDFPVECCATFPRIAGVDWSDHGSFWHEGYRALMVTDTAPFRYPHYHEPTDTPDKIDYPALARVTQGVAGVIAELAR